MPFRELHSLLIASHGKQKINGLKLLLPWRAYGERVAFADSPPLKRHRKRLVIAHALAFNLHQARRFNPECRLAMAQTGTGIVHDGHFCSISNHEAAALRLPMLNLEERAHILNTQALIGAGWPAMAQCPLAWLHGGHNGNVWRAGALGLYGGECHRCQQQCGRRRNSA